MIGLEEARRLRDLSGRLACELAEVLDQRPVPPSARRCDDLLQRAPLTMGELPAWFASLNSREQLDAVWVAAIVERVSLEECSVADLARALRAVRDWPEVSVLDLNGAPGQGVPRGRREERAPAPSDTPAPTAAPEARAPRRRRQRPSGPPLWMCLAEHMQRRRPGGWWKAGELDGAFELKPGRAAVEICTHWQEFEKEKRGPRDTWYRVRPDRAAELAAAAPPDSARRADLP